MELPSRVTEEKENSTESFLKLRLKTKKGAGGGWGRISTKQRRADSRVMQSESQEVEVGGQAVVEK